MQQVVSNIPSLFAASRPELEAQAREKAHKATAEVSDLTTHLFNESSLGLYRIHENVHRRVPQLVRDRRELKLINDLLTKANKDLVEAKEITSSLKDITAFHDSRQLMMRIVRASDKKASR
ncbi:hypothetical protein SmJEL517_g04634 [Synchytrium microbalum]|uniref:Biogenesis of lysosome-related organelles complex 1 subunit 7 n=1 Tax=Synchytrium microbalum TaxID=1806994 RepID=A0A507BZF0_9FUNG|nr:uncharacterized protein SmJEL517_g04634 [Synchytrium microbalum]TPX32239.1 hypothetical protein SmJEL517_g04634 [Synchytrium microbalum]